MAGFEGKTLEIDLSSGKVSKSALDKDMLRKFIGGSGLGAKLIFDRVDPHVDPLSPKNPLFLVTGPLSGNTLPGGSRFAVCAKAPLTNMFGEANCGGDFASEMRMAGWDELIFTGASDKPVYLLIQDDKVEIKDASDLWGKGNFEVNHILKERHGGRKPKVVAIGQGGEKMVKFAAVCNGEKDFAARCGMGAIMGSKKLKAIVAIGTGKVPLAEPEKFAERRKIAIQKSKGDIAAQVLGMMGTSAAVEVSMITGDIPGKNWTIAGNQGAGKIGGAVLNSPAFLKGTESCHGCIVGCKRVVDIKDGVFKGLTGAGPEYEGIGALGSNLMIEDLGAVIKMNQMCNDYGVDVISCGGTIAWAMECFEKGILTTKDLDGIELKWGNYDAVMQMITKIAKREGIGDVLAEGSKRAAQKIGKGSSEFVIEVKGLEVPMHDPRSNHGLGLSYATGSRGACHTNDPAYTVGTGIFNWPEFGLTPLLAAQVKISKGWGPVIKNSQDLGQIVNAGILCYMVTGSLSAEDLTDLMVTSSGFDYSFKELAECGERIWHMKRGVNNLMGITAKDDTLPKRIVTPPTEGGAAGSAPDLKLMLEEFYPARGLSPDGRPTKETLARLGLNDLSAKLYK
jgi:aldehyde:ferredoxin oxidoreductase